MRQVYLLIGICISFSYQSIRAQTEPATVDSLFGTQNLYDFAEAYGPANDMRFYQLDLWAKDITLAKVELPARLSTLLRKSLRNTGSDFVYDPRFGVFLIKNESQRAAIENLRLLMVRQYDQQQRQLNRAIARGEVVPLIAEIQFGTPEALQSPDSVATLSGEVREAKLLSPLSKATILIQGTSQGAYTDSMGRFSVTLPVGEYELKISAFDREEIRYKVKLFADGAIQVNLLESLRTLDEVVIQADREGAMKDPQMGVSSLQVKTLKRLPPLLGEPDIFRSLQLLPGVSTTGEATNGFNVRGGSSDQNLILFDDAPVYNPSHLFGFFSAIQADASKSFTLYKSSIPARYGGRLSSVLAISPAKGHNKSWQIKGGISPVTGRLLASGPLSKRATLLVGARTTYSDWLLNRIENPTLRNSRAAFQDGNLHLTYQLSEKDRLSLTGYLSQDVFRFQGDTTFSYQNATSTLRWRHVQNDQFFWQVFGTYSRYAYQIVTESPLLTAQEIAYDLQQASIQAEGTYSFEEGRQVRAGFSTQGLRLSPGSRTPLENSIVLPLEIEREQGIHAALFAEADWRFSNKLSAKAGLRYSFFGLLGPGTIYNYASGVPRSGGSQTDSTVFTPGEFIQTYHGPEWRLSLAYTLTENQSFKLALNRTRQYLHRMTNTAAVSPTDAWTLSDPYLPPQIGDQLSLGYFFSPTSREWEFSLEGYYRWLQQLPAYKNGAELLLNPSLETALISGDGWAYGLETLIQKNQGRLTGWLSYTYSRTFLQVNGPAIVEQINGGAPFPADYDQPHDLTLVTNYNWTRHVRVSSTLTYRTGRPLTLPVGRYIYSGNPLVSYSDRNALRLPDYFRWDISVTLETAPKRKRSLESSWVFAVYNLTGRANPFSVYFVQNNGEIQGYQLAILGRAIFSATYQFEF